MERMSDDRLALLLRGQGDLMQELHDILTEEDRRDERLMKMVMARNAGGLNRIRGAAPERVFGLDEIHAACLKYRLRFLPAHAYKGKLPSQAVYRLRRLEAMADSPLQGFMMLAPAACFKLCDCDADPLLFLPLEEDRFYLVHRWGADMSRSRALQAWPVRNWQHLAMTVVALAWITGALLPTGFITTDPAAGWWGTHRLFAMFWTMILGAAATVYGWFTFFGQFSVDAWNSRTFN